MDRPAADTFRFSSKRTQINLITSIHKRLLIRLVIAGSLISIALAAAVYFIEVHRLGGLVNSRAGEIVLRFNDEIRPFLDRPILIGQPALRDKLKLLLIAGKLNLGLGSLVSVGIYNLDGKKIAAERDTRCPYLDKVDEFVASRDRSRAVMSDKDHEFIRINELPHILLTFPLTNSLDKRVAVIKGVFAVSSSASDNVSDRIIGTALEGVAIVALTTLILYPIIITLIRRLTKQADNLLRSNIEILRVLGSAIAKRDSDTDIHNYRVTIYAVTLAETLGLNRLAIRGMIKGAFLHDVGKIGISDRILLKPGKLTQSECEVMKGHVNHGIDIVQRSDWLKDAKDVVGYHHERFDGKGYPYGLADEAIPINARIFSIADVFDALTSVRPYKSSMSFDEAMATLEEERGSRFDPALLDAFAAIAKTLYDRFSSCPEQELRDKLAAITRQYFSD